MVDFLMMFSLCICVLSGVTLLIVHIWSKKSRRKKRRKTKQEVLFSIAGRGTCQSP